MFSTSCIILRVLFCPLEALTDTSNIRQATIKTSQGNDCPKNGCMLWLLFMVLHTHTQKHQPKNIICPHTFFTTPSVTVEAPNVQCQGLSLSVCAGNQGLWQVLSSQIPWTSQQFRSFTQLPGYLANSGVSSYPNVGSLSSLKNSWMQFMTSPRTYVSTTVASTKERLVVSNHPSLEKKKSD